MTPSALAQAGSRSTDTVDLDSLVDELTERAREEGGVTLEQLRHRFDETGLSPAVGRTVLRRLSEAGITLGEGGSDAAADSSADGATDDSAYDDPSLDEEAPTTDLVRLYLTDIGKVALLNAEQEVELSKRIEAGVYAQELLRRAADGEEKIAKKRRDALQLVAIDGERAKRHLLEANLRLVVSLAKRYQGKGLTLLDLVQEGNIGLVRAVEKFDYAKGYKFSTYATWWIRQALQRAIADQGRTIRVPVHMVEQINKAVRMRRHLDQELGRPPTYEEIAEGLGSTPEKVEEILGYGQDTISLESPVGDTGDTQLGDLIEDSETLEATVAVEYRDMQQRLGELLASLPERSATVMSLRYGVADGRTRTLAEVGHELGLTRERVRQIERDTIKQLRRNGTAEPLRAYLN